MGLKDREDKQSKAINETLKVLKGKKTLVKGKRVEIVLKQDTYDQLTKLAEEKGLKNATYIRFLINNELSKNK